jgi:hypothetical protein
MLYVLLLRDIAEISIYSLSIFILCKWLKTDKTKNILGYFLAYSTLMISAWIIQLPTLMPFLFSYAPVALLLFIVLHEKTLQRNLVALCAITPSTSKGAADWIYILISSCLTTINANKSISIVIEHTDALNQFLDAPFIINADMSKNVFDILVSSSSYDEQKMIWINTNGTIRGINVSWIVYQEKREDSLFYTLQSDALVLTAQPSNRLFTLINNGQETKNIPAHQVRALIQKQLSLRPLKHKGAYRENNSTEKSISG